jgi:hypothetical protein
MPIDEKQITNKQHAVPQNIMDVDFKIIGDLTLREFFYLLIFFGLAYWAYMTIQVVLKWPLMALFILTGLVFARGRFGERGMDEWVVNFFRAIYNPTQKVWKKNPIIPVAFTYQNLDFVKNELITLAPTATRRKLENYLDSYNTVAEVKDDFEVREEEYIRKVSSYNYAVTDTSTVGGNTTTTVLDDFTGTTAGSDQQQYANPAPASQPQQQTQKEPEKAETVVKKDADVQADAQEPQQPIRQAEPQTQKETPQAKEQEAEAPRPAFSFDIKSLYHKKDVGAKTNTEEEKKDITPPTPSTTPAPTQTPTNNTTLQSTTPVLSPVATPEPRPQQAPPEPALQPEHTPEPEPEPAPKLEPQPTPTPKPEPKEVPVLEHTVTPANSAAPASGGPTTIVQPPLATESGGPAPTVQTPVAQTPSAPTPVAPVPTAPAPAPLPPITAYKDNHTSQGMQKILSQMKQHQEQFVEQKPENHEAQVQTQNSSEPQTPSPTLTPAVEKAQPAVSQSNIKPFMPKRMTQEDEFAPTQTPQAEEIQTAVQEPETQTAPAEQILINQTETTAPAQEPMIIKSTQFRTPDTYRAQAQRSHEPIMPSITPDRVAGRRFTPLALDQQGTIILPIRGEKVLRTESSDDPVSQQQLEEKTRQLQILLEQIRRESGIVSASSRKTQTQQVPQQAANISTAPVQTNVQPETLMQQQKDEEVLQKLQSENQRLIDEIGHLRVEMAKTQALGNFQQQEQILQSASIEQEVLRKQIEELQNKIAQQNTETDSLRKREQQRIEDERKQAETLRLMMQMQSEKDRKEHARKEKEALEKYEQDRKKLDAQQREQADKQRKESEKREAEQRKKQEEIDRKFAEEENKRIEQEQKKAAEQLAKEQELQRRKDLELEKQKHLEAQKSGQQEQQYAQTQAREKQDQQKVQQEQLLRKQKEDAENALKAAEAKAYEEQKRIEVAKARAEEERKKQEEAFKALNAAGVPTFAKMQPITNMPNAVSGVVKTKEGKTIEGILVIIKRENGEPVRALKTNILGQFSITTPLSNGVYVIEVNNTGANDEKFDIIKLTVDGKVIPPLEFTGH